MDVADVDDGRKPGSSSDERAKLVKLRRQMRVLEIENEILKRTAAYFAKERILAEIEHGELIVKILDQSFGTYGAPRVTAELRLGLGRQVNHKRV
jgi:hypothetical protein